MEDSANDVWHLTSAPNRIIAAEDEMALSVVVGEDGRWERGSTSTCDALPPAECDWRDGVSSEFAENDAVGATSIDVRAKGAEETLVLPSLPPAPAMSGQSEIGKSATLRSDDAACKSSRYTIMPIGKSRSNGYAQSSFTFLVKVAEQRVP